MIRKHPPTATVKEDSNDLGFGSRLSQQHVNRMMNRDGSFNVDRDGLSVVRSMSLYHWLITISWTKFILLTLVFYMSVNVVFGWAYYAAGPDALNGTESTTFTEHYWNCFFFSVETFATIGYGALNPRNPAANILMTVESFFGFVSVAMITGLLFARFARPNAKILYSDNAVVAPFKEGKALMVRIINQRSSQLINIEAQIIFSLMKERHGKRIRQYHSLPLDRQKVTFFPLHWTIVHEIDEKSPLHGMDEESLKDAETEMFVLISATDETYSQTVHSRSSYRFNEIVWNARFKDIFIPGANGKAIGVNMERIHEFERLPEA